jgi:hypothetical protein
VALVASGTFSALLLRQSARLLGAQVDPAAAPLQPDRLLLTLGTAGLGGVLGWLALALLVSVLAVVPGRVGLAADAIAGHIAPRLLRAAVSALLAGTLTAASATIATAATGGTSSAAATIATAPGSVPRLPSPVWTASPPPADPLPPAGWTPPAPPPPRRDLGGDIRLVSSPAAAGRQVHDDVVVRRGDSLWAIVAAHLGPQASAAEIAAEWPRWYAANRTVIGPDPDLLHPGQRLRPPAADRGHQAAR